MTDNTAGAYTFADAQVDAAMGAKTEVLNELKEQVARIARAHASYKKARAELDRLVARAITTEPTRVNWYDHPGPIARAEVAAAASLSPVQLQRLMERERVRLGGPTRGKR